MAIRNIVKDGDPILLKKCRPVEKFDAKLGVLTASDWQRRRSVCSAASSLSTWARA